LHKTEVLAYKWLLSQGLRKKDIVYQKRKTPDFLTPKGNFEVKRAYKLKNGKIKILLTDRQIGEIQKNNAKILVFDENRSDPIAILEPNQLSGFLVGNIVISKIIYKPGINLSLRLDDETYWQFKKVKARLKAETNEQCLKKLLELVK